MDFDDAEAIKGMFSTPLKPYSYFKDQFAVQLVGWAAGEAGISVSALKRSRWASLLTKEPLKRHSARHAAFSAPDLAQLVEPQWKLERSLAFYRADNAWAYGQVSRPGGSLVLRLDWGKQHEDLVRKLGLCHLMPEFERRNHMETNPLHNFAWARIDLDWETGEALIEEVQTDWLRSVRGELGYKTGQGSEPWDWTASKRTWKGLDMRLQAYWDELLAPLERVWDEMMLSAALDFLRNDLGFCCIYMHTHAGGNRLKGISPDWAPPRSLYEDLPRRFCFARTSRAPAFLQRAWGQNNLYEPEVRERFKRPYQFWYLEL